MDLRELIETKPLLVGDGAMGSRLMALGLGPGECGELWDLENPDAVERVHREYVDAGADYVLTNTFGANALVMDRHGMADRVGDINRAAVEIARRAAGGRALVFGDVGPCGRLLEPYGDLSPGEARAAFAPQVRALADAGVDAIICETFESGEEMRLVLELAGEHGDVPLIASMKLACEPSGRYRSMMGEGPSDLLGVAAQCGCSAAGSNCGQGIETMARLVGELADLTDLPVIVQPNAGMPRLVNGETVYPETPSDFSRLLPDVHEAGARIVGGCCGTTPEHIRAIRRYADSL